MCVGSVSGGGLERTGGGSEELARCALVRSSDYARRAASAYRGQTEMETTAAPASTRANMLQQHCPQVDRPRPHGHQPQAAPEPPRVLQEVEVHPPRPPQQEDSRHPSPPHRQREGCHHRARPQEGRPLPPEEVRSQGIKCSMTSCRRAHRASMHECNTIDPAIDTARCRRLWIGGHWGGCWRFFGREQGRELDGWPSRRRCQAHPAAGQRHGVSCSLVQSAQYVLGSRRGLALCPVLPHEFTLV